MKRYLRIINEADTKEETSAYMTSQESAAKELGMALREDFRQEKQRCESFMTIDLAAHAAGE